MCVVLQLLVYWLLVSSSVSSNSCTDDDGGGNNPTCREPIPVGVTDNLGREGASVGIDQPGQDHVSTFEVVPKHEELPNRNGVKFNVETVPEASKRHSAKPAVSRQHLIQSIQASLANHYTLDRRRMDKGGWPILGGERTSVQAHEVKIEALSESNDVGANKQLVHAGPDGLVMAMVTAFDQHLPLELSPDAIWVTISYAFAKHVDKNAEALRKNFVKHEGKKRLLVKTPSNFAMSNGEDPDTGASAKDWETFIFPNFSNQIKEHIGTYTHEAIAASFSTTTPAAKACHEITLMSAMKRYFRYVMGTECGIPQIKLLGTEEDWVQLRARAEHLGSLMTKEFSELWMPLLLPVLDEFVESYKGNVNRSFWQSMVKLRTVDGSGVYSFISGWMPILFPYLGTGDLNTYLRPWHNMYFSGPELEQFPPLVSSAPVVWQYHGKVYDIDFAAGVLGFAQDTSDGTLSPMLGWYVAHSPPKPTSLQLEEAKKELHDLLLDHGEEAWYRRVTYLQEKIAELESKAMNVADSMNRQAPIAELESKANVANSMNRQAPIAELESEAMNVADSMNRQAPWYARVPVLRRVLFRLLRR